MSALTSLKLSNTPRSTNTTPVQHRRNKLLAKITEQIRLAEAVRTGTEYYGQGTKRVLDENGYRKTVEVPRRIRQWWWTNNAGKICFTVRYGARSIELAKGKTTVDVGAMENLVETLRLVHQAVQQGELDMQIAAISGAVRTAFKK